MSQEKTTDIYAGNLSIIVLANNLVFYDRSKYIDTRFHYLRYCIANKEVARKITWFRH